MGGGEQPLEFTKSTKKRKSGKPLIVGTGGHIDEAIPYHKYWFDGTTSSSSPSWKLGADPYGQKVTEKKEIKDKEFTMKEIPKILDKVYENHSLRKSIVPLFIGNPGLGKTVMIQEFADSKGAKLVELITSQMSPFEISGIAMPDKEDKKMKYYNFDKLEDLKDGDILFFDELLNGNPVVLNACLTILEQRKFISGKPLPNIMIVAAANPQGMSPLTPQIKERFVWYDVKFNKSMWIDYMNNRYSLPKNMGNMLANMIQKEDFKTNNFMSARSVDKAVNMMINKVYTPYEKRLKDVLTQTITNPFKEEVQLTKKKVLAPDEMISWLELMQIKQKQSA